MEQYERLLDQAQENAPDEEAEDPRKLRPGEIDPTPETKPARPDPIDMDEDEKEMLSEARARLANTRGKKAKRKARERQMEDSRRLSSLQKRRELKAAGIESKLGGMKKRKYIDYAREIPFQKVAPAGFYAITDEVAEAKRLKLDPSVHGMELSKMEGRHQKEEEDKLRQKDKKALKKLFAENAPLAITKVAAENDPVSLRRRASLSLPAPQVTDAELEDIVKIGQSSLPTLMGPPSSGPSASQALLGDYSHAFQHAGTPQRTPLQENIVLQEARNLLLLRDMTPFSEPSSAGLPELYEGTGFQGVTPRTAKLATPNTLLGSPAVHAANVNGTPLTLTSGRAGVGNSLSGMGSRPMRDHFGLNEAASVNALDDAFSVADSEHTALASAGAGRRQLVLAGSGAGRERQKALAQQLLGLPEPEYSYEVSLPGGVQGEEGPEEGVLVEDAADLEQRRLADQQLQQRKELQRRSEVIRRGLPRPPAGALGSAEEGLQGLLVGPSVSISQQQEVSAEVNREMLLLLLRDEHRHPPEAGKRRVHRARAVELEEFADEDLARARREVAEELQLLLQDPVRKAVQENFSELWEEAYRNMAFQPGKDDTAGLSGSFFGPLSGKMDTLQALQSQFAALKAHWERLAKREGKLQNKLLITTQGYSSRAEQLEAELSGACEQFRRTEVDYGCYEGMKQQENRALKRRLAAIHGEVNEVETAEAVVQKRYADVVRYANSVGVEVK